MKPWFKRLLRYSFSVALSALFLFLAFRGTDLHAVVQAMKGASYSWIALMFAFQIASHLLRAWRWRYLLDPIKPGIRLRNLFSGVMIGYLMNNVLPRAGELARPYSIGILEGVSKSSALGTIVVERIMDTFSFLLLLAALPFIYDGPLRESFPWLQETAVILTVVAAVVAATLGLFVFRRDLSNAIVRRLAGVFPERLRRRIEEFLRLFLDGFLFLKRPGKFLAITVQSFFVWFLYIIMMYVAFRAFGLESMVGFRAAVVVLTISSIGVMLPTPGSTGTWHFFVAVTLTRLFFVPENVALSYATVTHAATFIGTTLIGLYFLLHDHIKVLKAVGKPAGGTSYDVISKEG